MDIKDIIKNGENKTVEFKERIPKSQQIVKTAIAFANGAGGKILIGVNDNREIVGIDENEDIFKIFDSLNTMIYDSCYPNINTDIYSENKDNKTIIVIEVFPGNLKPYYLKSAGKRDGVYIRIGASNRKASEDNIFELERQRRNMSYDEEIDTELNFNDIDFSFLKQEFKKKKKELTTEKLINLGLLKKEGNELRVTRGAGIISGIYDNTTINCASFEGNSMKVFLHKQEFTGDIFEKLKEVEKFCYYNLKARSEFNGLQREDLLEIPQLALREGIINAIIHRDYSNQGRDIKIGIYDDVVKIVSPGGLPNTLTIDQVYTGRSEIRNKILAKIFKELDYIEKWGSGINRMITLCKEAGLREPEIEETGDSVELRFYRGVIGTVEPGKIVTPILPDVAGLTPKEKEIYELIEEKITRKELQEMLNISERSARRALNNLEEFGLMKKVKKGPKTYYRKIK